MASRHSREGSAIRLSAAGLAFGFASTLATHGAANPTLEVGVWQDITPDVVTTGAPETCIGQGLAVDLQDPNIIYWGTTPFTDAYGGLFKTTDAGSTWERIASITPAWEGASDHLDMPLHVRIDPNDSNHLYSGDGVRGSSTGFFVSTDAGATFVKPKGFVDARIAAGIDNEDIYDVAVDPTDFSHLLLSFHYRWGWDDTKWNKNSGIMESTDGGDSFIIHDPVGTWGTGHSVNFLYSLELGLGDANTWLLGTQGNGMWRTTDAGANWKQVTTTNITHGGGDIYYASNGLLYAGGEQTLRSSDNGDTWESVGPGSSWTVHGDGTTLFSGGGWGSNQPFQVSPESDGATWANYNSQTISDGPYEMKYDATNGILYSSSWFAGLWALKLGDGTGVIPDPPGPPPATGGASGTGGSAGATGVGGSAVAGGAPAAAGDGGSSGLGGGGASAASGGTSTKGGAGGTNAGSTGAPDEDPGCACDMKHHGQKSEGWALLLAGAALVFKRGSRRAT